MTRTEVHHIDCMELMHSMPDNYFHLAVADPPYGLDPSSAKGAGKLKGRMLNTGNVKRKGKGRENSKRLN